MLTFKRRSSRSQPISPSTSTQSEFAQASDFERAKYPILAAPFHGLPVPVMVRELTQAQILSCGDFSLIDTFADRVARKTSKFGPDEILAYAERTHSIARAALVHPTYDEILTVFGRDRLFVDKRSQLDALKARLREASPGPEREQLEKRIDHLRIWVDLVLPEDFLAFIVGYALGIDKSDIKLVSEEMLLNAAVLAEKGRDNPCDHIGGAFTPWMKDDINTRAWVLLMERREKDKQRVG